MNWVLTSITSITYTTSKEPFMDWCRLVPELCVSDFSASWRFYVETVGFKVRYRRSDPQFAYLDFEGAQLMLEELQKDSWVLGDIARPYGRGMNLQLECADVEAVRDRLLAGGYELYHGMEDAWYETNEGWSGQRQFIVPDPDGYLLRFCQYLGDWKLDPQA